MKGFRIRASIVRDKIEFNRRIWLKIFVHVSPNSIILQITVLLKTNRRVSRNEKIFQVIPRRCTHDFSFLFVIELRFSLCFIFLYFPHLITYGSQQRIDVRNFIRGSKVFRLPGATRPLPGIQSCAKSDSPLTKAFNKRASRPGRGEGERRRRGIYSRGSSCFDVNDEARDPLWISR